MYLLYLDESGAVQDKNQIHFVLAGISIYERQGFWISQELDRIAATFNQLDPTAVELHGSPMLNGAKFWRAFPLPKRINAIKRSLDIFAKSHKNNCCFGVVVKKSIVFPRDPLEYAFEQICSRFDQYLWRMHLRKDTQRGIIVFDEMTRKETSIQELAKDFRTIGHRWGVVRNLAEVPVFMDSRASRLLQLADLISYSIFRFYERNDNQFFEIFNNRFDSDNGVVHGLHRMLS